MSSRDKDRLIKICIVTGRGRAEGGGGHIIIIIIITGNLQSAFRDSKRFTT